MYHITQIFKVLIINILKNLDGNRSAASISFSTCPGYRAPAINIPIIDNVRMAFLPSLDAHNIEIQRYYCNHIIYVVNERNLRWTFSDTHIVEL